MRSYTIVTVRLLRNLLLLLPAVFAFLLIRTFARDRAPRFLRWLLETAGAGFVKLGQLLALRADLLPLCYCQELAHLLDQVRPIPVSRIIATIEADLNVSVDAHFLQFSPTPIGSASLAQVHLGRLRSGEQVAVKVLRPDIESRIEADLVLMGLASAWYDALPLAGQTPISAIAAEVRKLTAEELDLRREARYAHQLHQFLAADSLAHRSPKIYFELVGRRVLTMEFFSGPAVTRLLEAVQSQDQRVLDEYAAKGITPRRIARLLFQSIMRQVYRFRLFHADPHPSNLIMLESGELGFIDFGMVGFLDERICGQQYQLFEAISRGEIHRAYVLMVESLQPLNQRDLAQFEAEFKSLLQDWIVATRLPATLAEKSTGRFLLRTTMAIRRAGLALPTDLMRLHRTTLVSDMVELQLCPQLDLMQELRDFFREETQRRLCECCSVDQAWDLAKDANYVASNWFRFSHTIMAWLDTRLPRISQAVEYELTRFDEVTGIVTRAIRSAFMLSRPLVILIWLLGQRLPLAAPFPLSVVRGLSQSLDGYVVLVWIVLSLLVTRVLGQISRTLRE